MRQIMTLAVASLVVTAPIAGQTPTPAETQKTFTCSRTAAVIGEGFGWGARSLGFTYRNNLRKYARDVHHS